MVGDPPDFVQLRLGVDRPPRAVIWHLDSRVCVRVICTGRWHWHSHRVLSLAHLGPLMLSGGTEGLQWESSAGLHEEKDKSHRS